MFCINLKDSGQFGKFVGCFSSDGITLEGPKYNLSKSNNPLNCLKRCFRCGFSVAGLFNTTFCSCGHFDNISHQELLPQEACTLPCPSKLSVMQIDDFNHEMLSKSEAMNISSIHHSPQSDIYNFCGGTHAIKVFETGLSSESQHETNSDVTINTLFEMIILMIAINVFLKSLLLSLDLHHVILLLYLSLFSFCTEVIRNKSNPEEAAKGMSGVRIAFIFTVNGRSSRQIKRLLKNLYSPNHFYYFHVDQVCLLFVILFSIIILLILAN